MLFHRRVSRGTWPPRGCFTVMYHVELIRSTGGCYHFPPMPCALPFLSRDALAQGLADLSPEPLDDRALDALHAHYQELSVWNRRLSLIGPGTLNEVLERHYGESLAALPLVSGGAGLDIGSGA